MKFLQWIIMSVLFPIVIMASPINESEKAYQKGNYNQAKQQYESLLKKYPKNDRLWYNVGNVYLKMGQIGHAIFAYRSAAKLNGYDASILSNLNTARTQVVDQPTTKKSLIDHFQYMSLSTWFWLANIGLIVLFGIVLGRRYIANKEVWMNITMVLGVVVVSFWTMLAVLYTVQVVPTYGVVVAEKVAVKSGPSESLPTLFYLHEGVEFKQLQQSEGWIEVVLTGGLKGWVFIKDCKII